MAIHQLNLAHENQLKKPLKFHGYFQKANGISFWAFLLSIFIYISIFYIFSLSASSLLNTTKFWFLISNTLILIIAADFSAFSSSEEQAETYEHYYLENSSVKSFPSFESQLVVKDDLKNSIEESLGKIFEFPLNFGNEAQEKKKRDTSLGNEHEDEEEDDEDDEEEDDEDGKDDDDEFSTMSNEELNRRVEEFIQRCNRQIRLQAVQDRIHEMQK